MQHFKTYHSPVYRGYKGIDSINHREIVRYFEDNEKKIVNLEFDEYFELLVAYSHGLFEIGQYSKHTLMADVVIEASILHNVQYFRGEDVYFVTLFEKAASFYNLYEYKKAEHILRELIKIDPYNAETVAFYKNCLEDQRTPFSKRMRAAAMAFFLITPFIISLDVLFIQPFEGISKNITGTTWKITFLLGWVFYLTGDLLHRFKQRKNAESLVEETKKNKRKSQKEIWL